MRPVIGIVPSIYPETHMVSVRDHYLSAVVRAGGTPVVLPLTSDDSAYETLLPMMDGFILSGGNDIDAQRYGEQYTPDVERIRATYPTIQHGISRLTPTREEVECLVLSYAYRFDVPVLGICRGMQMMNVHFGGTLYTDLAEQFAAEGNDAPSVCHWQDAAWDETWHDVRIAEGSVLADVLQERTAATNSMHHQGVRGVAPLLRPSALGPDGLVEAVEVADRSFMVGVQWHPEFFAEEPPMSRLFRALIESASHMPGRREGGEASLMAAPQTEPQPREEAVPARVVIMRRHCATGCGACEAACAPAGNDTAASHTVSATEAPEGGAA